MTLVPLNLVQEQLSLSYVQAVTYRAGWNLSVPRVDHRGIDGTLEAPVKGMSKVDFQLKSTTVFETQGEYLVYDLRVENYNQLVAQDDVPRILILFVMPNDPDEWLSCSAEELCLRHCAYWVSLMGETRSTNASTHRVHVPLANLFHPDTLQTMFDHVSH